MIIRARCSHNGGMNGELPPSRIRGVPCFCCPAMSPFSCSWESVVKALLPEAEPCSEASSRPGARPTRGGHGDALHLSNCPLSGPAHQRSTLTASVLLCTSQSHADRYLAADLAAGGFWLAIVQHFHKSLQGVPLGDLGSPSSFCCRAETQLDIEQSNLCYTLEELFFMVVYSPGVHEQFLSYFTSARRLSIADLCDCSTARLADVLQLPLIIRLLIHLPAQQVSHRTVSVDASAGSQLCKIRPLCEV